MSIWIFLCYFFCFSFVSLVFFCFSLFFFCVFHVFCVLLFFSFIFFVFICFSLFFLFVFHIFLFSFVFFPQRLIRRLRRIFKKEGKKNTISKSTKLNIKKPEYKDTKNYKPSGKLVYNINLFKDIEDISKKIIDTVSKKTGATIRS